MDHHQVRDTSCSNDVCSVKVRQESSLAAPAKAGIGATVSSAISCTGQHIKKDSATFGTWAEECIPAALMSGGIGLVIGAISKVPLVGPVVPVAMQAASVIDACSDAFGSGGDRCTCEL